MEAPIAFICDYAEASGTGKINALGIGFRTIYAKQVPVRHSHFSLVVQLETSAVEAGQKEIQVSLIDNDGNQVIPPRKGSINIPVPKGSHKAIGHFVMEFGNVEFKQFGTYAIQVGVGGVEVAYVTFNVAQLPNNQQQQA